MRGTPTPRRWPSLILLLALGCGDSVADEGDDEVGDTSTGNDTSGDASDNLEAGSEGNETTVGESESEGSSGSGTADDTADDDTADDDTAEAPMEEDTGTETEEPIDCTMLDEPTCLGSVECVPYMGMPYTLSGDGMDCLGPSQFLGCLVAADACLPATGTLCMGDDAFHVDSLCPPPAGFESCEPPADAALPCI